MSSFPSASHLPPNDGRHPPKADLAPVISAVAALHWAYAAENVRAQNAAMPAPAEPVSALTIEGRGSLPGLWSCDADAIAIDALVQRHAGGREHYLQIASASERRAVIEAEAVIAPPKAGPWFERDDRHPYVVVHPKQRRPWYCPVVWGGVPFETAELLRARHAALYGAWLDVLMALDGRRFSRWRVAY